MKYLWIVLLFTATCFAQLPDAPSHAADRTFWTVAGINSVTTSLDAWTTITRIGPSQPCPYEVWNAWEYGRVPSAQRTIAVMGAQAVGSALLSWQLKKHKKLHFLWAVPMTVNSTEHMRGAIHNFRHCG